FADEGFLLKAIATCKRVLELDPNHKEIQARLADLYSRREGGSKTRVKVMEDAPGGRPAAGAGPGAIEVGEASGGEMVLEGSGGAARAAPAPGAGAPILLDAFTIEAVEIEPIRLSAPAPDAQPAAPEPVPPEPEIALEPLQPAPAQPAPEVAPAGPGTAEPELEPTQPAPVPAPPRKPEPAATSAFDIDVSFVNEPAAPQQTAELPEIPLFSDLEPQAFIALVERMRMLPMRPGEWILREGEAGHSMFTIASGKVRVLKRLEAKKLLQLAVLGEGQFFGEMAVLRGGPRGASVQAVEAGDLFEITREVLDEVRRQYPTVDDVLKRFAQQRLLRNVMATSPLFKPFSKDERVAIIERFVSRDVEVGEQLVTEGVESDGLYLVLRGSMDVLCAMADGHQVSVGEIREGEVFGEISCLKKKVAIATVRAKLPATVLRLPRQDFDTLVMSHPQILELVSQIGEERIVLTANLLAKKGILV
ncbi:MAG TPA: cyclic nucleotide-binding domain-containing protein, partial [Myxococcota bacterium]|nr:cyclic nucleotide-binding domain-containing protein [Myxococcota bacterium]